MAPHTDKGPSKAVIIIIAVVSVVAIVVVIVLFLCLWRHLFRKRDTGEAHVEYNKNNTYIVDKKVMPPKPADEGVFEPT